MDVKSDCSKRSFIGNISSSGEEKRFKYNSLDDNECLSKDVDFQCGGEIKVESETIDSHDVSIVETSSKGDISTWNSNGRLKSIKFNKTQKLLVPAPSDPLEAFRLLLDDDILDLIVRETNLFAVKLLQQSEVRESSSIRKWKQLTSEELLTFIALLLHTGTMRFNKLSDYWKKHWLFNVSCFSQYMPRDRFMSILRCLHFSSQSSGEDQLAKIRPLVDHFNDRMNTIYQPGKQLSLDDSFTLWDRRILRCHYIKNKRDKYGIKFYILAEPEGIVQKFQVYAGKTDDISEVEHSQYVVMKLLDEKLDSGHSVYMDDYYNSYDLAVKLLDRQTYCTGTLIKNRKGNPVGLDTVSVEKDENKSFFKNGVHIGKWNDKRYVYYISTEHGDEMMENIKKSHLVKPSPIIYYNKYKYRVQTQDHMLLYYPCETITLACIKKLFIHTLQMSMNNAFYFYNKYAEKKMNFYDFRLAILEKLLPKQAENSKTLQNEHKLTKIEKVKLRERKIGNCIKIIKEVVRKPCKGCREKKMKTGTPYECRACNGSPGYCTQCFC